mgnify:CR=1 FL=1
MRKTLLIICSIGYMVAVAQTPKKDFSRVIKNEIKGLNMITLDAACDSIGWPIPPGIGIDIYGVEDNGGFVAGNNVYGDKAKGNYFDISASAANYVTRIILGLGPANGANGGNLTKPVSIKILDGTSGTPGAVLGTYQSTLQEMNLRRFNFTLVTFNTPVTLPASKKFFLILDFNGFTWTPTTNPALNDSIALLNNSSEPAINTGWEQYSNNSWHTMLEGWNKNYIFHIYPLVSETVDGCGGTLPVIFGTFTGKSTSIGIDLNWQTITETNNQRFEVERSTDALKFTSVGTVATKAVNGNHQGQLNYQFTDATPAPGVNYYRIRQIDKDGSSEYSKMVKVSYNIQESNSIVRNYYPNPVSDKLFIQLGAGIRQVETVRITDASGKIISAQKPAVSPEGIMNVSTKGLRSGLNFATVILPDGQQSTIKVMKD